MSPPADPEVHNLLAPSREELASVKVFPLISSIRSQVSTTIDSPLNWDQLTASDINFSIVRPLVFKYAALQNLSVVYCCLVCRSYFLNQIDEDLAFSGVMLSRAMLCEILAMKLLASWTGNYIQLVAVLTTAWNPLVGASGDAINQVKLVMGGDDDDLNCPQSALEMAISTEAKTFISSPITQKVVNDIYTGRVVFSTIATRSMLADNYKPRAIEIYDSRNAPFIDHYRLRVPKYGAILEFLNFSLLLVTFLLCLSTRNLEHTTFWEVIFVIFAVAFCLEEYTASSEHGWIIYIANMWNVFDTSFVLIFLAYSGLRIKGLVDSEPSFSDIAFDILACGACILFPRLAFFAVSNNVIVLSLRVMIAEFCYFVIIAMVCFSGLLFTLWTLASDRPDNQWSLGNIAWLMVQIWFGNTYLSFAEAASFHEYFGPFLMTIYAALSGTLLLTILISILSNTVARIDANATQEYLFQFAISTIEGVQSNALVSYQPPFNLLALLILKPASYLVSPRTLHTTNVLLIKTCHLPILFVIGMCERYFASGQLWRERSELVANTIFNSLPRHVRSMPLIEALVGSKTSDLYEALFEVQEELDEPLLFGDVSDDEDMGRRHLRSLTSAEALRSASPAGRHHTPPPSSRRRRPASVRSPRRDPSPLESPRLRPYSLALHHPDLTSVTSLHSNINTISGGGEIQSGNRSPLARMFGPFTAAPDLQNNFATMERQHHMIENSVKRVESLVDDLRDLPVSRLKDEMKELQDRQARIENLLLVLTRGMRHDVSRHDTLH